MHTVGRRTIQQQENAAWDKELAEIRARMDELEFGMQQDTKSDGYMNGP
jgi:hypothetical protein